jgi:hypothetical protein
MIQKFWELYLFYLNFLVTDFWGIWIKDPYTAIDRDATENHGWKGYTLFHCLNLVLSTKDRHRSLRNLINFLAVLGFQLSFFFHYPGNQFTIWPMPLVLFPLVYFSGKVLLLPRTGLGEQSCHLCLIHSWDYRNTDGILLTFAQAVPKFQSFWSSFPE